ncbi:ion channel [Mucilaginibacter frigoritolerans]|uniref:Ion channel n=1 Tax=Mucilaginibacter frigoritolerans TaxID=652788 RepID=A0A562UBQ6_9SPHI|nr:potassium channel family protein [Mucilaginibacter frigoritolerans]TWJ03212.1 ion channel [Mucilaginibacter frigoritolerans]
MKKISYWLAGRKYEILVLSFLVLIFGNTFCQALFMAILLPLQNMLAAFIIFYREKRTRIIIGTMIVLVLGIALLNCCYHSQVESGTILGIYFLYFILISSKVYTKIFKTDQVSSEVLAVLVCGFILLCLTNAIIFITIEVNYPNSYLHMVHNHHRFDDLIYFSFTTMLTIGYGDIVPLTLLAKRSVILAGLTGHLYTVLVTGIIIGKYLQDKRERPVP